MTPAGTFPASLPQSLSDPALIRENDWRAFQGVSEMENHWRLKDWPENHSAYYWFLTFDDEGLIELSTACQMRIDMSKFDPIQPKGLHVTVLGLGSSSQITTEVLDRIIRESTLRVQQLSAFQLEVGPLAGSKGALRFSVSPWTELAALHHELRTAAASVAPSLELSPTNGFRPHLGIAYSNTRQAAAPLIQQAAALRSREPAKVMVEEVKLVQLRQESREYRWANVHSIGLTSTPRKAHDDSGAANGLARLDHS